MWTYVETVRIAQDFGQWHAQVTLSRNGELESPFVYFRETEPSPEDVALQGRRLALQKNLAEAHPATTSIPKQVFLDLFTNQEAAKIYRKGETDDNVLAFLKKLEGNPTVNLVNPMTIAGLRYMEATGLLNAGRADQILGLK